MLIYRKPAACQIAVNKRDKISNFPKLQLRHWTENSTYDVVMSGVASAARDNDTSDWQPGEAATVTSRARWSSDQRRVETLEHDASIQHATEAAQCHADARRRTAEAAGRLVWHCTARRWLYQPPAHLNQGSLLLADCQWWDYNGNRKAGKRKNGNQIWLEKRRVKKETRPMSHCNTMRSNLINGIQRIPWRCIPSTISPIRSSRSTGVVIKVWSMDVSNSLSRTDGVRVELNRINRVGLGQAMRHAMILRVVYVEINVFLLYVTILVNNIMFYLLFCIEWDEAMFNNTRK